MPSPLRALPCGLCVVLVSLWGIGPATAQSVPLPHPILFVTQVPVPEDFATIGSTFANHLSEVSQVARGGDLMIRYPDGTLRHLTREAGFGEAGVFQGAAAIAVRDPCVHWDGQRALFSMVVGATEERYEYIETYWQIYEVTGLGVGEPVAIRRLPGQPPQYNNITPIYSPDGRIVFTSDRPRNGARNLYPQHDEYESTATNTGLWSLDPLAGTDGDLRLLNHTPSGAFTPTVDSFGRILFTRWDHLQRDQQADAGGNPYGVFNWTGEGAGAAKVAAVEVFPEPREAPPGARVNGLRINHFFPWQIHPDGTGEETLNHIGRHELHDYFEASFRDDPALEEFFGQGRVNQNSLLNFFQLAEDPTRPGTYLGVDAPEFETHASGYILEVTAPPGHPADQITVTYITAPDPAQSGHYRDPLPLADGRWIAAHTAETRDAANDGTRTHPVPRYDFRLKVLSPAGAFARAGAPLTSGIARRVEWWDPDERVTYDGPLWELSPVEVRARPVPPVLTSPLPAPEAAIFAQEGVDPATFRADLERRGLALMVSRNITTRDALDRQQPFNLQVAGTSTETRGSGGKSYGVAFLQLFQGDQIRGIGGTDDPQPGRRVLAVPMHDARADNPDLSAQPGAPPGSVAIAADGSVAALVPSHRAMTWQLTDPQGAPVVRERYWLTFQPGEIRVCPSCHGLNSIDQAGHGEPQNAPEALRRLLQRWRAEQEGGGGGDGGDEAGGLRSMSGGPFRSP